MLPDDLRDGFVDLPSLRMHYVEAGPRDGFPVVLLHGFPEFWYSWRFQIPALAKAGYRVIAPDQRGYNLTDKTGPFTIKTLIDDVRDLLDALKIDTCYLVGHDWGGPPAWGMAAQHRDRVSKLVTLNGPHPRAYSDALRAHPKQILRSWYIYFFQLPWLPEKFLSARDYAAIDYIFDDIPVENMTIEDRRKYKEAYSEPGALTAMIGWYRALPGQYLRGRIVDADWRVDVPALVIWGENDRFLESGINDTLSKHVPGVEIHTLPESSHWTQMHAPEEVNGLLLKFFAS